MVTDVEYKIGPMFILLALICGFIIPFIGCILPFFFDGTKDAHHYCGVCHKKVGIHKPCSKGVVMIGRHLVWSENFTIITKQFKFLSKFKFEI